MVPYIPEDYPFSAEQRAWLGGFLAGLKTRLIESESAGAGQATSSPLNVLYGTQTGNAEAVANDLAASARKLGMSPVVQELDAVSPAALAGMRRVVIVCSTYGEGEMPDNAQLFWDALSAPDAPRLEGLDFCVLALGDTGYDGFCQAGKLIDMRLEQLGAARLVARIDCDVDFEDAANGWIAQTLPLVAALDGGEAVPVGADAVEPVPARSGWSRKNPYPSLLAVNRTLSGKDSAKEIRHYEFDLDDSGISYEAGDALGVFPVNDAALVAALASAVGIDPDAAVDGFDKPFGEMLTYDLEISTPPRELVTEAANRANDEELTHIMRHGDKEALESWLWGRDVLDLVTLGGRTLFNARELLGLLRPLQHRAYSISSSPLAAKGRVHLTVASVRYTTGGRQRGGVCSTFLADRVGNEGRAGIFASPNKSFRVPADHEAPMIMVGPGTGLAPFRACLQERRETGAKGRNWLFFGDQRRSCDFIYEDEMTSFVSEGTLTRLDVAFSRDQADKIYVQTRMKENGRELFGWLEQGGHFYVCGDASRMARDVDQALHEVIALHGAMDADKAAEYVSRLKREKRYLRDVY